MLIKTIAASGGILFILTLIHFVLDWIFQSHETAMNKHNNPSIRAKHCLWYAFGFLPIMWLLHFQPWEFVFGLCWLFLTHYIEDSYLPVFLWAKYVRKPIIVSYQPVQLMLDNNMSIINCSSSDYFHSHPLSSRKDFAEFVDTQLGKILMITVDQIIHVVCLIPLVWMALIK